MKTTHVHPHHIPNTTTIKIPCDTHHHRVRITRHGTISFQDHPRTSLHFQSLFGDPQGCAVAYHVVTNQLDWCELSEPVSSAFAQRYDELCDDILTEWKRCWHNARLRTLPYADDEHESFWNRLGLAVSDACHDLSDEIYEQYGERLTFSQYGRSGATIAPREWVGAAPGGQFGGFNGPFEYRDSLEDFVWIQRVLAILRHINAYWHNMATSIDAWWAEKRTCL